MADPNETNLWTGTFSAKGLIHSWLLAGLITVVLPIGGIAVNASPLEWNVILGIVVAVWLGLGLLLDVVFYLIFAEGLETCYGLLCLTGTE